jgi:hypothetical protein
LALAAITPAMLAVVIFLLSLDSGRLRAVAFMAGRLVTYAGWSIVLFIFTDRVFDRVSGSQMVFSGLLKIVLGLILSTMAIKITLGGDDPEDLPTKIVDLFEKISVLQLFGLGVLVSLFQARHIMLLFVGVTQMLVADLTIFSMVFAALVLIGMLNAPQLVMIGIDLAVPGRATALFQSLNTWLSQNNQRIAAVIGLTGAFLFWNGIRSLVFLG